MGFDRYATLGHSYGAFVALQHAVERPGRAAATIVSSGAASARHLAAVVENLATFEPVELRDQVTRSWARGSTRRPPRTATSCCTTSSRSTSPTRAPAHRGVERRTAGIVPAPELLRHCAVAEYGAIEVEDRLGEVTTPALVLAGATTAPAVVEAAEAIAAGIATRSSSSSRTAAT